MTMPTVGATGAVSPRTVSLARRISRSRAAGLAPVGITPATLLSRKKVKVRIAPRDRNPPAVTSSGWARAERNAASEKLTTRTVVTTGQYQAQPLSTPLSDSAAPPTANETAPAMAQG